MRTATPRPSAAATASGRVTTSLACVLDIRLRGSDKRAVSVYVRRGAALEFSPAFQGGVGDVMYRGVAWRRMNRAAGQVQASLRDAAKFCAPCPGLERPG